MPLCTHNTGFGQLAYFQWFADFFVNIFKTPLKSCLLDIFGYDIGYVHH